MTLLVPWLVFPLVLAALSLGTGLLVEQVSGLRLPSTVLIPVGLAAIVAVGSLTVSLPATAKLTTPLIAALAVAGLVLGRLRRPDGWALGASLVVFLCYGAPVMLSGAATFAGYIKLDDTATFLALTDRILEHGRSLAGLAPSSYEATLSVNLAHGYPLGSLVPLAIGHQLVRTDVAWLYQPWLAFCGASLALCLYPLAAPLVERKPLRALIAGVAAQPALLYGYALWGGVKELAAAALVGTAATLTPTLRSPVHVRNLLPFAIASAAVLDTLSAAGVVWLIPLLVAAVPLLRRRPAVVAASAAAVALFAVPAIATAAEFLRGSNRATFEGDVDIGNLIRPLRPLQMVGIWPTGDFRTDPDARFLTAFLVGLAVAAALAGIVLAFRRRAVSLLLAVASVLTGAIAFLVLGGPWVEAKAFAIAAPVVLLIALAGCAALATAGRWTIVPAAVVMVALVGGVLWSNALAYHEVNLAPRAQLVELQTIGDRFAGQGPALMTEYQPYGVRHFLRRLDAEGVSELRRRPLELRGGRMAGKGEYVDLDQLPLSEVLVYRTLVLRRSPTASRPPAPFRLVWRRRWYEVWRQEPRPVALAHIPLGGTLQPAAVPSCGRVRALATVGQLAAPPRPPSPIWALGSRAGNVGTHKLAIRLPRPGRYRLWVGGSVRGRLTAFVDGERIGSVSSQLQNAGQWLDLGLVALRAGTHVVSLGVNAPLLQPGVAGGGFSIGPLLLQPESKSRLVRPAQPRALCGRSLDWLEALAR